MNKKELFDIKCYRTYIIIRHSDEEMLPLIYRFINKCIEDLLKGENIFSFDREKK